MIVVTGATGQLGIEFKRCLSDKATFLDSKQLDLHDLEAIDRALKELKPKLLINAAAYNGVDKAESEPDEAMAINAHAPTRMAELAQKLRFRFIHVSTDFVFDGTASKPYSETSPVNPLGVYGRSKADGEKMVLEANPGALVVRTSWVHSSHRHNFVKTVLRVSQEQSKMRIVSDQVGTPTYARDLADAILKAQDLSGLYHYSNEGVASRYEVACAIKEIKRLPLEIEPIRTEDYPTPAKRPAYSVLDKTKIKSALNLKIPHWMESLEECLNEIS